MKNEELFFRIIFFVLNEFFLIGATEAAEISNGQNQNVSWLENMVPKNYNARDVPVLNGDPAKVKLILTPWTIGEISLQNMYFFINMYIALFWTDHRLAIPNHHKRTILPEAVIKKLWIPSVTFRNCMACGVMQFKSEREKFLLLGKEVLIIARVHAKLFCNFNIANYPMDSHYCRVEIQSAQAWLNELILIPITENHTFLLPASLPQFDIEDQSSGYCSNAADKSGSFVSCVEYKMKFVRKITYHLMLTYCPCGLIVLLSWISFWLDIDLAAPRVALGLTSLLTLSTQFSNAQKNLPPVSYLKAIDVWFIFCMFMVFASLVEFAICYTLRKIEKKKSDSSRPVCSVQPFTTYKQTQVPARKKKSSTFSVDFYARIAFPVTFSIFNLCYWSYYGSR